MPKYYDLTGQTFGRLTVIERVRNSQGVSTWRCLCSCGREVEIPTAILRSGNRKSCGCARGFVNLKGISGRRNLYQVEDYLGKQFGFWTVIGYSHRDKTSRNQHWLCRCRCGIEKTVCASNLFRSVSTKCDDCAAIESRGSQNSQWKGGKIVSGTYMNTLRHSAKHRGIEFDISIDDLERLWEKQCGRCAYTNEPLSFPAVMNATNMNREDFTASLDRRDSSLGYTADNVQWVHKIVNVMKMDLNENEFFLYCMLVAQNWLKNNNRA